MKVTDIREVDVFGYPGLEMKVDGIRALFTSDLKRTILFNFNAVYLGPEFEKKYKVMLPADPSDSRGQMTLQGFTDDPKVIDPIKKWIDKIDRVK